MNALKDLFHRHGHWLLALVWAGCAFAVGPVVGTSTRSASRPVQLVIVIGLWTLWAIGLLAALVRLPAALVVLRVTAPGPFFVSAACAVAGHTNVVAVAVSTLAALGPFAPTVADRWVQGGAYGHEKRFVLRAPGALLLGPIELTWVAAAAAVCVGPLLLANRFWIAGILCVAAGVGVCVAGFRSYWVLADRWLVIVPAGVVLHDRFALSETVMCPHRSIGAIGAATVGTNAYDFTMGSLGLAIEVTMREPVPMTPRPARGGAACTLEPSAWLCTPSSPAAFLAALPS